ncbi:CYFA0S09e00254g1_1 [Cyberlindnera fabianii]|uniref:CYFA0S09e00254g1_1 n=1 Tax=Cyberlindnera fabianii TaxID=36022 RepID=A0A061B5I5_CYBFA|nr:CYFA0S09e00254g1_1 [Cyberlindnera fabianii]
MDISSITDTPNGATPSTPVLAPVPAQDNAVDQNEVTDITEDEDTVAGTPEEDREANDTLMESTQNDTDGTVSEGDAGEDTEIEISDVSEDESVNQDQKCEWKDCSHTSNKPSALTEHILKVHIDDNTAPAPPKKVYRCRWTDCHFESTLRYNMLCHVRKHTNDKPFFCFVPSCADSFPDTNELSTHLVSVHNESRLDNFEWLSNIDQMKIDNLHPIPRKESRSIKRVSRMTEREVTRTLDAPRVDFLRIQNVKLGDIVTEPLKKKGRTANAEINADLRAEYRDSNGPFKDHIKDAVMKSFEENDVGSTVPTHIEIDELDDAPLKEMHEQLERKLVWSLELSELLNSKLKKLDEEKQRLWNKKELLLDATIAHDLPDEQDMYLPK